MRLKTMFILSMAGTLLFMTGYGMADEISLKNGDRITGEVIRMQENQLVLKTAYAGEITVAWEEVLRIKTDRPIKVVLKDDTSLKNRYTGAGRYFEEKSSDVTSARSALGYG